MATVLDLVKASAIRLVQPVPSAAMSSTDPHVAQILAAMVTSADELLGRYPLKRQLFGGLWLRDKDGRSLSAPNADTDTVLIDETLMRSSIIWRWRYTNGYDYAEEFRAAEERLSILANDYTKAQRGGSIQG
ncbi:hypothetical protein [Aureimonas sp. N4]|uniref:hypothetical protein n=1 Tax=Aureimonas sp. N4 TaxID=1638165 RepID=UPI0007832441|nr:hypothetical protein [Aureimonas sp. N4]